MAGNLISDGTTITTTTGAARTVDLCYVLGTGIQNDIVGVASNTYLATEVPTYHITGEFDLTKTAAANSAFSPGSAVYGAAATGNVVDLTTVGTARVFVGTATETVTTTETSVKVIINFGAGTADA